MIKRRNFLKAAVALPIIAPFAWTSRSLTPIEVDGRLMFPTGIGPLDEALGGGMSSGLVGVVGFPGTGKTALLRRIHKAGLSRYVSTHVRKKIWVCPLTGKKHYVPDRIYYDWLDRPVALIDDIFGNARYGADLRKKIFSKFFMDTWVKNNHDKRLAIFTSPILQTDTRSGSAIKHPTSVSFASAVVRVHQLDNHGRGRISIIKNRYASFLGELFI